MSVLVRRRVVWVTAFLSLLLNLGVVNGQVSEGFWSHNTYLDVNDNTVFGMRFQSPLSQTPNLDVETVFSNSLILVNVCANVPKPSTVNNVSFDWNHIETLELEAVLNTANGLSFNGGHFGQGNFPATFTVNNQNYNVTYRKVPPIPLPDRPYEVIAEVKKNGVVVPATRSRWSVFPDNWMQAQMRAVVTQAWGILKPTLNNRIKGDTNFVTLPAPLNFTVGMNWSMSCDPNTQLWSIRVKSAYPKL